MVLNRCGRGKNNKEQEVKLSQKFKKGVLNRHRGKLANINPRKHANRTEKGGRVHGKKQHAMDSNSHTKKHRYDQKHIENAEYYDT